MINPFKTKESSKSSKKQFDTKKFPGQLYKSQEGIKDSQLSASNSDHKGININTFEN